MSKQLTDNVTKDQIVAAVSVVLAGWILLGWWAYGWSTHTLVWVLFTFGTIGSVSNSVPLILNLGGKKKEQ